MRIQNQDPGVDRIGYEGKEFETIGEGIFEVPDELAAQLTNFPQWSVYYGEGPAQDAATAAAAADAADKAAAEEKAQQQAAQDAADAQAAADAEAQAKADAEAAAAADAPAADAAAPAPKKAAKK